jgi:hypothetical protein
MNELTDKNICNSYKAIILVIASYENIYYNIINTWKKYMRMFDNVKIYFVYCRSDIDDDLLVCEDDDTIFYNCEESLVPGIFLKSIHSMNYCHQTFKYDYLIRANLSSFYNIPKLIEFLDVQPKTNFAGGINHISHDIPFISGSGIIISYDLVEKMLKSALEDNAVKHILSYPDDVILSYLINLHINPTTYTQVPRVSVNEELTNEKIEMLSKEQNYFHFRNRNDNTNRILDSTNINLLAKYFYNV